nr:outer membrane protein transport protein [FCB group bacterium]
MTIRKILLRFILSACILTSAAIATNGMNMIGYGARMSGMGGVSFGMTNSAHLMNTNPAGITSINGNQFDYGMAIMLPALNYKNYREFRSWVPLEDSLRIISQFSYIPGQGVVYDTAFSAIFLPEDNRSVLNDKKSELGVFPLPTFGFVNNSGDSRWAWGLGLYAQGGMGATYKGIKHDIFRDFTDQSVVHDPFTYQAANEFRYYNENSGWLYNEYEDDLGNPYFADSLLISNIPTLGEFPFDPIKYHSKLAYMKFIQTFAYELTPEVSVGLALNLGFSMMEMAMPYSISPDLMVGETTPMLADPPGEERVHTFGEMFSNPPELMGLGYNEVTAYALLADNMADAATAISFGSKLGVQFKMSDQLTLGTTFTPEV